MRGKTAAALLIVAVSAGLATPAGAADTPDAAPPPRRVINSARS